METPKKTRASSLYHRLMAPLRMARALLPSNQPRRGIRTVGAWCGSSALRDPKGAVKFAAAHGIDRLDVIVNDHSKDRAPTRFSLRDTDRIRNLADVAHAAGLEVHLMSWVMPHADFIHSAADKLLPLAEATGASSIQWDAEEPWTLAKHRLGYPQAAKLIDKRFRGGPPMGVTGIGYASREKLTPLAAICDYAVPQCYSTHTSGLNPKNVGRKFTERWERVYRVPVVCGLAAYRQHGIPGYKKQTAMEAAIRSVPPHIHTVIYWSLPSLQRDPELARVVACAKEISGEKWG